MTKPSENGQASVEVTPEMIRAGARVFREWERQFADAAEGYPLMDCDYQDLLPEVFRSMFGYSPYRFMNAIKSRPSS